MIKIVLACAAVAGVAMCPAFGQKKPASPPEATSVTINGKAISIKYSAPSVRGRKIFGEGGQISKDPHYPVWRAGANAATALHTDADLDMNGLAGAMGHNLIPLTAGLLVAILAFYLFNDFSTQLRAFDVEMQNTSSELVDYFAGRIELVRR